MRWTTASRRALARTADTAASDPAGSLVATAHESLATALENPRFEVIPIRGAEREAALLPKGSKVAVTCSPTHGIRPTLQLSERLVKEGLDPIPHISARMVRSSRHLDEVIDELARLERTDVFVIAGDAREALGPYEAAVPLLEALTDRAPTIRRIGIPGYPESHPLMDHAALFRALEAKRRFASYIVTQICFDAAATLRWISETRRRGFDCPIYVGIPGVVDRRKLLTISMKIGIGDSMRFVKKQGGLATRLLKGTAYNPETIVRSLAPYVGTPYGGIETFHINTFNHVAETERWRRELSA